jgi:hypothetical protein
MMNLRSLTLALVFALGSTIACTGTIGQSDPTPGTGGDGAPSGAAGSGLPSGTGGSDTGPGPDVKLTGDPLYYRFVRLTHEQWEQSARDLLGLSALPGLSETFTTDPPSTSIFSNNEKSLFVSSSLRVDYQLAAETLGPMAVATTASLAKINPNNAGNDPLTFIRNFGKRAFRRPLTAAEEARYQSLFTTGATVFASGNNFKDGVQLVVEAMLQSPNFLYRTELGTAGQPLSGYEVASKLSFLLRNTMPDDALLTAAAGSTLTSADGLAAQARTMLDAAPARAVFQRFHTELFGLDRYRAIQKDTQAYPSFNDQMNADLQAADTMFFDAIFTGNQGFRDILLSNVAFANQAIAPLYGLTASGTALKQVTVGADRPGFFTRAGFLAFCGTLRDPDPIHRGVDIVRRVMGQANLEPPAGIVIPPLPAPTAGQTNRERVTAHTGPGTCGETCHGNIINPVGFAFENFDTVGKVRTTDNGKPVDTTGSFAFADGTKPFTSAPELIALMADAPQTHLTFAAHLAEFALGREVKEADRPFITALQSTSMTTGSSLKQLVLGIVKDPAFRTRGTTP